MSRGPVKSGLTSVTPDTLGVTLGVTSVGVIDEVVPPEGCMHYLRCVEHVSRKVFANRYIVTPYRKTGQSHQSGSYSKSQHSWIVLSSHHLVFLKPVSTQVHLFVSVGNTSSCLQYQVQVSAGKIIGKFLLRIPTLCK